MEILKLKYPYVYIGYLFKVAVSAAENFM